jgi:hypothetical protein
VVGEDVARDPRQPSGEVATVERLQSLQGPEKDLTGDVLGEVVPTGPAPHVEQDLVTVSCVEDREGLVVTVPSPAPRTRPTSSTRRPAATAIIGIQIGMSMNANMGSKVVSASVIWLPTTRRHERGGAEGGRRGALLHA